MSQRSTTSEVGRSVGSQLFDGICLGVTFVDQFAAKSAIWENAVKFCLILFLSCSFSTVFNTYINRMKCQIEPVRSSD